MIAIINSHEWNVSAVKPNDPRLLKNGQQLAGCAMAYTREICINGALKNEYFRQVLIHELTHAYLDETDISDETRQTFSEEELASFNEHNAEAIVKTADEIVKRLFKKEKSK